MLFCIEEITKRENIDVKILNEKKLQLKILVDSEYIYYDLRLRDRSKEKHYIRLTHIMVHLNLYILF